MSARKIYLAASVAGGRREEPAYERLAAALRKHGELLTAQVGSYGMSERGEALPSEMIHDRDLRWIYQADALVAEVSTPSLGVGYQIGRALSWRKPVLCLHRAELEHPMSKMLLGCRELVLARYELFEEIPQICREFFAVVDLLEERDDGEASRS